MIAVTLADGTSLSKIGGVCLPGGLGHLRLFETIGGLGSSMVISTEDIDGIDAQSWFRRAELWAFFTTADRVSLKEAGAPGHEGNREGRLR